MAQVALAVRAAEAETVRRMWAHFDGGHAGKAAAEWFDHAAAALYLRAETPRMQPDQLEMLRRLTQQEKLATRLPLTTAYEDLALYSGKITIGTLVRGLY